MDWICADCNTRNKRLYKFCFGCGAAASVEPTKPVAETAENPPGMPDRKTVPSVESAAAAKHGIEQAMPSGATVDVPKRPASEPEAPPGSFQRENAGAWRCHECWFDNPTSAGRCAECGTPLRASARADLRDRAFGVFGKFGKWPLVVLSVVAVTAALGWLYFYLNPKHGDRIEAPAGLETEIRASLDEISSRQAESIVYFNCFSTNVSGRAENGGYAAFARLVPRSANVANRSPEANPDADRFWRFIAHREGYGWRVERFASAVPDPPPDPCAVGAR